MSLFIPWRSSPLLIVASMPRVSSLATVDATATTAVPFTSLAWRPMVLVTAMVDVNRALSPIFVLLLVVTMRPFAATFASISLIFGHGRRPAVLVGPACVSYTIFPFTCVVTFSVAGSAGYGRGQHGLPGCSSRVSVDSIFFMAARASRTGGLFGVGVAATTTMATTVANP